MAEVERIVDRKTIRGRVHYLVAWRGFGVENNTWESRVDLISDGYRQQINDFEKARKNGDVSSSPTSSGSKSPARGRGSTQERSRSRSRSVSRSRPATPKPQTPTRSRSRSVSRTETPRKSASSAKKPAKTEAEASSSPRKASPRSSSAKSLRSPSKTATAEETVQGDRCPLSLGAREWFLRIVGALVVLFSVVLGHFLPSELMIPEQLLFLGGAAAFLAPFVSLLVLFFRKDDRDFAKWIAIFLVWRGAAEFLLYVSSTPSEYQELAIGGFVIANLAFVIALVSLFRGEEDSTSATAAILAILGFLALISSDAILLKEDLELTSLRVLLMSVAVIAISFTPAL